MSFVGVAVGLGSAAAGIYGANKAADAQKDAAGQAGRISTEQYNRSRQDLAPWVKSGNLANDRLMQLLGLGSPYTLDDPAVKSNYDKFVADFDAAHRRKYGLSIWDTGVDTVSRDQTLERLKQTAIDRAKSTATPTEGFGSLLDRFTGDDLASEPGYQFGLSEGQKAIERAAAARGRFDSGDTLKALTRFGNDYASTKFGEAANRDAAYKSQTYGMLSGQSGQGANAAGQVAGLGANAANATSNALMAGGDASAAGIVGGINALNSGLSTGLNYYQGNKTLDYLKGLRQSSLSGGTPFGYKWG